MEKTYTITEEQINAILKNSNSSFTLQGAIEHYGLTPLSENKAEREASDIKPHYITISEEAVMDAIIKKHIPHGSINLKSIIAENKAIKKCMVDYYNLSPPLSLVPLREISENDNSILFAEWIKTHAKYCEPDGWKDENGLGETMTSKDLYSKFLNTTAF